jgi:hypothetical protein
MDRSRNPVAREQPISIDDLCYREEPAPVCGRCGADVGIFLKFGSAWKHYREGAALGQAEIFDPGHAPEVAWRLPTQP